MQRRRERDEIAGNAEKSLEATFERQTMRTNDSDLIFFQRVAGEKHHVVERPRHSHVNYLIQI